MECISYTNNHTPFTEKIPVPLQRLMIKEYCQKNKLNPKYEHNEITTFAHMPILFHLIESEPNSHLLLFSLFSLPQSEAKRAEIAKKAYEHGVVLHFANEDLVLEEPDQLVELERIYKFLGNHEGNMF